MPVMSGLVLARYVLEMAPHVPVVLVTGYLDEVTAETLSDASIAAVVSKPYTLDELKAALNQVRVRKTS
jgi:CheY-like chemotaxis protein